MMKYLLEASHSEKTDFKLGSYLGLISIFSEKDRFHKFDNVLGLYLSL